MFDKAEYWKNRKAGIRGQGVELKVIRPATVGNKSVTKKALRKNTKRARKLQVD
ncbi:MAG TPA: hypothetical protein VJ836_00690 [Candidatus Saccharimonadales bacterium]|nr:hypothetical protein [Candidatus Saccharimonadales bacterium]